MIICLKMESLRLQDAMISPFNVGLLQAIRLTRYALYYVSRWLAVIGGLILSYFEYFSQEVKKMYPWQFIS